MTYKELKKYLSDEFKECADFSQREAKSCGGSIFTVAYISNLCGKSYITEGVLKPLCAAKQVMSRGTLPSLLAALPLKEVKDTDSAVSLILSGNAIIFGECAETLYLYAVDSMNEQGRSISEPDGETVIRGPHQGFVESAETNVVLLRKIIKNQKLKVINKTVGTLTKTQIKIMYLDGVARDEIIELLISKIEKINIPSCVDSGYLEQYLQDSKKTLLSCVGNSEKPDKVAGKILGGRIAIICDGSPVVLTVPYIFNESLQSTEDYCKSSFYSTFQRSLRLLGLLISLYLPSLYIAILEFHRGALPYSIFKSQSQSRRDVPFDVFVEMLVVLLAFELIREVGVRMPKAVGNAVSIVGGLILGDAAISAGLTSETVIVIAAISGICNFMTPTYMNSSVMIRFLNLIFAKIFGLFGLSASFLVMLSCLCAKKSFGVPYMASFAPANIGEIRDGVVNIPTESIKEEPDEIQPYGKK